METHTNMTLLLDGDLICYRCCFSVKDGDFIQTVDSVDSTLDFIFSRFDYPEYRLFLTGSGNFRNDIAVTKKYKGNRDPSKRPKFYKEVREYLINFYNAEIENGYEADDLIGMNHVPGETVVCSYDKDLKCLEGTHFNWVKNEVFEITYPENVWFFYYQMLVGDPSDSIEGVPGIGDKKAKKLLDITKPEEWREIVEGKYKDAYGDQWFARFDESARLLHILRDPTKEYYDYI